jgi:hypothetical protein
VCSGGFFSVVRGKSDCIAGSRHCEERERRSNPVLLAAQWIASLALAMTAVMGSRIIKIATSSLDQHSQYLLSRKEPLVR